MKNLAVCFLLLTIVVTATAQPQIPGIGQGMEMVSKAMERGKALGQKFMKPDGTQNGETGESKSRMMPNIGWTALKGSERGEGHHMDSVKWSSEVSINYILLDWPKLK